MDVPDLFAATQSGDRRATLVALRDRLAHLIASPAVDTKTVAPLVNQFRGVLAELDDLPAEKGSSVVDDLAARRTDRRAAASGGDVPAGGDVVGS